MTSVKLRSGKSIPEKILFDVNVILDVIENRAPYVQHSGPVLKRAEGGHVHGYVCASSIDTLAFLLRRSCSSAKTHSILQDLLRILSVATVDEQVVRLALAARWGDPEDAILYYAAKNAGCTKIVTRNKRDFKLADSSIAIVLPSELTVLPP